MSSRSLSDAREREGYAQEPENSSGKRHANVTNVQREGLRRIRERYRSFTGRVRDTEEIDTQRDDSETAIPFRNPAIQGAKLAGVAKGEGEEDLQCETGHEKEDSHQRESCKQQVSSPKGIDSVHSREGEDKVDAPETKGGQ